MTRYGKRWRAMNITFFSPLFTQQEILLFWLLLLSLVLGYEIWRKMKLRCHDVALIYVSRTPVFSGFPLTLRQGRGA